MSEPIFVPRDPVKTYRSARELLSAVEAVLRHPHDIAEQPHFGATFSPHVQSHTAVLESVVRALYDGRHYFWMGIYLVIGETAVRQAFCGPVPPCHTFKLGKGNVGTVGQVGTTKVVADVSSDPTYSMCFRETKSELVAPIKISTRVLGVIDVESEEPNAFSSEDRVLVERVAERLARFLTGNGKYVMRHAREEWLQSREGQKVQGNARAAADSR